MMLPQFLPEKLPQKPIYVGCVVELRKQRKPYMVRRIDGSSVIISPLQPDYKTPTPMGRWIETKIDKLMVIQ